jgi:hemerythrin-like domain-containing protein/uncharacterized protein (DUF2249 family)
MTNCVAEIDLRGRTGTSEDVVVALAGTLRPGQSLRLVSLQLPRLLLHRLHERLPGHLYVGLLETAVDRVRLHLECRAPGAPASSRDYLSWDHRRLERLLTEATDQAEQVLERARARFEELSCALDRHMAMEELLLFPMLSPNAEADGLSSEHAWLAAQRRRLLGTLNGGDALRFAREGSALAGALAAHHRREERSLYGVADSTLDEAARERMIVDLQAL